MNKEKRLKRVRHKAILRDKLRDVNKRRKANGKNAIPAWPHGSEKVGKFE